MELRDKSLLITGGTGSFGHMFTRRLLEHTDIRRIVIFSRDEYKQYVMRSEFKEHDHRMRYFIGDVRDRDRLRRAMNGVDYVVHAAALKQVPSCEYNPIEAVKTNINGAMNVIDAALDTGVSRVVALSTDKAVGPVNLYGGTKFVSDKLFIAANAYSGETGARFAIVRYGNVAGSRGSVIPFFRSLIEGGATELPITHMDMTRFWITLEQGVELVLKALSESHGGETYISKIPSFRITDLAAAMAPDLPLKDVGIREGEKLHEIMVGADDARYTWEYPNHYIIYPHLEWWDDMDVHPGGKAVTEGFVYSSKNNAWFWGREELTRALAEMNRA